MPSYLDDKTSKPSKPKQKKARKPREAKGSQTREDAQAVVDDDFKTVKQLLEESWGEDDENEKNEWLKARLRASACVDAVALSLINDISDLELMTDRTNKYELNSLINVKMKAYKMQFDVMLYLTTIHKKYK